MADTTEKTSPAGEMRTASAILHDRVDGFVTEARTSPYWQGFTQYGHGVDNAMGGAGGRLAMLFTPDLAVQLAALLKQAARAWDRKVVRQGTRDYHQECDGFLDEDCTCFDRPLAIAREINKGAIHG